MATVTRENLPKSLVKLTITVPHDEIVPHLEAAALRLSEKTTIPGWRPGKAGYDVVKQRLGDMKIYEEALEDVIKKTYVEAVYGEKLETVGSPQIDVAKLAPDNDLVYSAEVAVLPEVEKLADISKISVAKQPFTVEEKDIEAAIHDLTRMQTREVRAEAGKAASGNDKLVVAMNMKKDGVAVEGGQSPNHAIYLGEAYYVPGLKEEVMGMKEGESKTFTLTFPPDHVQKMLAGAPIEFEVTVNELYHLESPVVDDAFAQALGQKDLASMKELIHTNIKNEKESEAGFKEEKEMLEALAKDSRFTDIPEILLNEEVNKMIAELEQAVTRDGGLFEDYLKSIKKTIANLKVDFAPQGMMRVKVALIMREIAKQESITVEASEVDAELDKTAEPFKDDKETKARIYSPAYREFTESRLKNRKVVAFLREKIIK